MATAKRLGPSVANSLASCLILIGLVWTTILNIYYAAAYRNIVQASFPDIYASQQEWMFGDENSGPLDLSIVYDYLNLNTTEASLKLVNTMHVKSTVRVTKDDACVARRGEDSGSMYAFCENLDRAQMPGWAAAFEALTIQTVFLSTPEQFRDGFVAVDYGVFQGYKSERNGWFGQDTLERMVCTTQQLATPQAKGFVGRRLFTKTFGILSSVDCASDAESAAAACRLTKENPEVELFDDGTGNNPVIKTYEVFRTITGANVIMHPFATRVKVGSSMFYESAWPLDTCLYLRGNSLGWFGLGYNLYSVYIPTIALIAKLQLIGVISVIWFVKYQCKLNRLHDALFHCSRLGIFPLLLVQILVSAYSEQDILRSIYSWKRETATVWILWLYIESVTALSISLLALQLVRLSFPTSVGYVASVASILFSIPMVVIQNAIAGLHYKAYTIENGLQPQPHLDCPVGVTGCAKGKFNYLYLGYWLALVPSLLHAILAPLQRLHAYQQRRSMVSSKNSVEPLTSFERICLEGESTAHVIDDVNETTVMINGHAHTKGDLVSVCGFTIIRDRFVVRTKDLIFLVLATILPARMVRDTSLVVWPLTRTEHGVLQVEYAKRIFLRRIHQLALSDDKKSKTSLVRGIEHPLA